MMHIHEKLVRYIHDGVTLVVIVQVWTDTWCSSGGFGPDGVLVQTGGWRDGGRAVRRLQPCDTCDWEENPEALSGERWYASQLILPDGNFIVIGGRAMFNYEYVPAPGQANKNNINLPFLRETSDKFENNLYPFSHLAPDGNIFLFANNRAILFEPKTGKVIRKFPELPGGSRNYPSSGMSALLPIDLTKQENPDVEVMICGGAVWNAMDLTPRGVFPPAIKSCGRISITDPKDQWHMEDMPVERTLGDMLILPNTEILIINGAAKGCAGWGFAKDPVLYPVLYNPYLDPNSKRFSALKPAEVARMYHSSSALLPDGSILVAGSNTNANYEFQGAEFPTEVRMEKFYPPYFDYMMTMQPIIVGGTVPKEAKYGQKFRMQFTMSNMLVLTSEENLMVTMYSPPFTTHGFSQNQRLLVLKIEDFGAMLGFKAQVTVSMPPSGQLAPPGYYMLFAVYKGIPSKAVWVNLHK